MTTTKSKLHQIATFTQELLKDFPVTAFVIALIELGPDGGTHTHLYHNVYEGATFAGRCIAEVMDQAPDLIIEGPAGHA